MSRSRGLRSSLLVSFLLLSCFVSLNFFRSKTNPHEFSHPTPHFSFPLSTTVLHEVPHGCLFKVRTTYHVVYGCSRMGVSPPIHLVYVNFTFIHLCLLLIPPGSHGFGGVEMVCVWCWLFYLINTWVAFFCICAFRFLLALVLRFGFPAFGFSGDGLLDHDVACDYMVRLGGCSGSRSLGCFFLSFV